MTPKQRVELRSVIEHKIKRTQEDIAELKELTKPVSPENSIGRISRMDAINNKSVNEAALRLAEQRLIKLKAAQEEVDHDDFGQCKKCGNAIQFGRLKFRPESVYCMSCVKK